MKRRKMMKSIALLLFFSILVSGCGKGEVVDHTISSKSKELDWAIAGIWNYETEESIPKEKIIELNQLLADKGKNYQIKFHFIKFQEEQLSKADEEILKKCDLITIANQYNFEENVEFYPTLLECAEKNMFEPLNEYMNTENGKRIKERMLTDLTLKSGEWEEKQWLLPTRLQVMAGSTLQIDKKLYDKSEIEIDTISDFTKCDKLFEKFYIANGEKPFLTLSDRKTIRDTNNIPAELPFYVTDMLTGCGSLYQENVLGSGSSKSIGNDLDTRNLLREPYFEEYLNAWRRYIENGYVNLDMNEKALVKIANSPYPEVNIYKVDKEEYIIPKSENYVLYLNKQPSVLEPFNGIGAESEQKELAFEALTDMITDKLINDTIHNLTETALSELVFHAGISEEGEKEYQRLSKIVPQFVVEHTFDTFTIPEIAEINKVYAEYSTEESDDSAQMVLERHFSKDGKVTEESIHEGIQRLNEKLDAAGMEKFIEALKEQKLKSKR